MCGESLYQIRFTTQAQDCPVELLMQMFQIQATHIAKFNIFEMSPGSFVGIEIRRISWQALKVNLFGCTIRQKSPDFYTAMDWRATQITNAQQSVCESRCFKKCTLFKPFKASHLVIVNSQPCGVMPLIMDKWSRVWKTRRMGVWPRGA